MESIKDAIVPRDRIKLLKDVAIFSPEMAQLHTIANIHEMFSNEMAQAIVVKLMEYNKVIISKTKDGYIRCEAEIEVIVPHGVRYGTD